MRLFRFLDSIRSHLRLIEGVDLDDDISYYATLHILQVACQSLIDMVSLIAASLGHLPSTYYEAGKFLVEEGAFSEEDLRRYRGIVGFRNIVVHGYLRVDRELVRGIVRSGKYRDLERLAEKALRFAEDRGIDP
ncbi:MAG: DUF86 domain-containing protein [Candidatus Korarchaeum sp.]